eukprot:COSAG01_NODE_4495_length_4976_cov_16.463605_5_plen_757_part_00
MVSFSRTIWSFAEKVPWFLLVAWRTAMVLPSPPRTGTHRILLVTYLGPQLAVAQPCTPIAPVACAYACGSLDDGCGGHIDCGGCSIGQACVSNACQCAPSTCQSAGHNCGTFMSSLSPGCGTLLDCGTCAANEACVANTCRCIPETCGGRACGTWNDGCGGSLHCGTCPANQHCDGITFTCRCTPTTCAAQHAVCGNISDGCGGTLHCGTCTGNQEVCNAAHVCECVATTCSFERKNCGRISDGCPGPGSIKCGTCSGSEYCNNSKICECVPLTCAARSATCGRLSDGCGFPHQFGVSRAWLRPIGLLNCGSCGATAVCNGTRAAVADPCLDVGMVSCGIDGGCQPRASCTSFYDILFRPSDLPVFVGPTSCLQCASGKQPNIDQTLCIPCPEGSAGVSGVCISCSTVGPRYLPNENQTSCECMPATCVELNATCGTIDDLCGRQVSCGACGNNTYGHPDSCVGNTCHCVPASCETVEIEECGQATDRVAAQCVTRGATCGSLGDGCGGVLACGTCVVNETYVSECRDYACACVPTSCQAEGKVCGSIRDRCGGTLACGQCADSACKFTFFADNMRNVSHIPRTYDFTLAGASTQELTVMIGDTVRLYWSGQHQWDHVHTSAYFTDSTAACPAAVGTLLRVDHRNFFGTYKAEDIDTTSSSDTARYLRSRAPCQIIRSGIDCSFSFTFSSIPLQSLPLQAATTYNWPHPPVSTFVSQTPPFQWRTGTYCLGTSTSSSVALTLRVLSPPCGKHSAWS